MTTSTTNRLKGGGDESDPFKGSLKGDLANP